MADRGNPETVYLIDASIYIFQSHFSPYVECAAEDQEDLSALWGFAQFLLQFLRRTQASHVAVAHDESLFCGFRHDLCPKYKSNRELPDENLAMQLQGCREISALLGLSAYSSRVYEADDIIGTLATTVRKQSASSAVYVVSKDKDLAQVLVSKDDCLWDYSGNRKRFSVNIKSEYGIHPHQFPDYLGLTGDSVDCITGVPGVGPVKAKELLNEFESMEGVYLNLDKVAGLPLRGAAGLGKKLEEHKALAELSKKLATIICEVEDSKELFGHAHLDDFAVNQPDMDELDSFLSKYKFKDGESNRIRSLAKSVYEQV